MQNINLSIIGDMMQNSLILSVHFLYLDFLNWDFHI